MIIYYDSKTGNVRKFADKLSKLRPDWQIVNIRDGFIGSGHLITFTAATGAIPATTVQFLRNHGHGILSASVSGNRNWGVHFAHAADTINRTFGTPILLKFELSGLSGDLESFIENVLKYEKNNPKI